MSRYKIKKKKNEDADSAKIKGDHTYRVLEKHFSLAVNLYKKQEEIIMISQFYLYTQTTTAHSFILLTQIHPFELILSL